jgi:hypothetical protein
MSELMSTFCHEQTLAERLTWGDFKQLSSRRRSTLQPPKSDNSVTKGIVVAIPEFV